MRCYAQRIDTTFLGNAGNKFLLKNRRGLMLLAQRVQPRGHHP